MTVLKTSLDFQSGYDAASKAKQLIVDSAEAEIERLRAALKSIVDDANDLGYRDCVILARMRQEAIDALHYALLSRKVTQNESILQRRNPTSNESVS